jgi:2-oxoglutarate dehydrogenase complex dehydrogenase (E1) component-like enzyme
MNCTQQENASYILELLQKYQNETDSVSVKSPNIFSLAKKNHQGDDDSQQESLEFDNEVIIMGF